MLLNDLFFFPPRFLAITASCVFLIACRLLFITRDSKRRISGQRHDISIQKTQILGCKISHRRLFPKEHGFVYPYLSVGVPVRSPTSNWLLSVDEQSWWKRGWLHVTAEDHLDRGIHGHTLAENIDAYLKQQKIDPTAFPHIYLLTSARFLNYKFSPASFWYLYTRKLQLKYVIAEVNNTFDERRMYLFDAPEGTENFKQTSLKDFHVSPFSSRKGSYALAITDPAKDQRISVTVTLRSSKGYPKLIARWWSAVPAIDPSNYPALYALWYLTCWGWTVLVTYPRIVFHAVMLAQIHKLDIWYRPEPRESAIPRRATSDELLLASIFMRYLQHMYENRPEDAVSNPSQIIVQPFAGDDRVNIGAIESRDTKLPALELRIHTPAFYRQMITYPSMSEFLCYTLLNPHEENRTARCNHEHRLIDWFQTLEKVSDKHRPRAKSSRWLQAIAWAFYDQLRTVEPLNGAYPFPGLPTERATLGSHHRPMIPSFVGKTSSLDAFVRRNCDTWLQIRYIVAALRLQWRAKVMGVIGGE